VLLLEREWGAFKRRRCCKHLAEALSSEDNRLCAVAESHFGGQVAEKLLAKASGESGIVHVFHHIENRGKGYSGVVHINKVGIAHRELSKILG